MNKQWTADISVSPELAATLIEGQFPQLSPVALSLFGEGWDNTVYQVNAHYVFRFPRRSVAVDCLQAEIRVLPELLPHLPLPAPNPIFVGEPSNAYPYPFMGYRMLAGQPAHRAHLTEAQRLQSAVPFAHFLRAVHDISPQCARQMGALPDTIGRLDIRRRLEKLQVYLGDAVRQHLLTDVRPFAHIAEAVSALGDNPIVPTCLAHGDLNFRNFLVGEDGVLTGVIDWGDVHIGHPAVDLAIIHSFLPSVGRRLFCDIYGEIDDETWLLSKFRALYTNLYILVYAHDIGDANQLHEARLSLKQIALEL